MRSFNFLAPSGSYLHLADQYYKVCIRRAKNYCSIGWYASTDTDSFKISRPTTNFISGTGYVGCAKDAVKIYGGWWWSWLWYHLFDRNYSQEVTMDRLVAVAHLPPSHNIQWTGDWMFPNINLSIITRYCGGTLNCQPGVTSKSVIISWVWKW